jgi:anti-sigma factor RsiW
VAALLAVVIATFTGDRAALLRELVAAHEAIVDGAVPLAVTSSDPAELQRWLAGRLPFRPFVPPAAVAGFHPVGARTLVLSGREGAAILFAKGQHRLSLTSIPTPASLPPSPQHADVDGLQVRLFARQGHALALWADAGILYALVSDDDAAELLEYARLCVRQLRR